MYSKIEIRKKTAKLREKGLTYAEIAPILNAEGYTSKSGRPLNEGSLLFLMPERRKEDGKRIKRNKEEMEIEKSRDFAALTLPGMPHGELVRIVSKSSIYRLGIGEEFCEWTLLLPWSGPLSERAKTLFIKQEVLERRMKTVTEPQKKENLIKKLSKLI